MEKVNKTMSVIYILWLRQVKRYVRSKMRMIGSLGQPVLFLVALGFGFGPVFERAGGGNYIQFLAPGVVAMSIIFTAVFSGIEVIADKQFGFLKETLVAPVSRLSIMIGRTLGCSTMASVQGFIVFLLSLIIGFRPVVSDKLVWVPIFIFLIALFFTALGTAIGSTLEDMHAFPLVINFVIMPLFFLSSALFPLEGLPRAINIIAILNPLTYGVDGIRGALTGQLHFGFATDFLVLFFCVIVGFIFGGYRFNKIEV